MARYNPFAERARMRRICEFKPDRSIVKAVSELEKLGWVPLMLAVKSEGALDLGYKYGVRVHSL